MVLFTETSIYCFMVSFSLSVGNIIHSMGEAGVHCHSVLPQLLWVVSKGSNSIRRAMWRQE